jgi:hypothetical protein
MPANEICSVWPQKCMFDLRPWIEAVAVPTTVFGSIHRFKGVVILPRPDMIGGVILERGAWHASLAPGEPGNVDRR